MRVLLLGGTSEATALAGRLAAEAGVSAMLSLAGAVAFPRASPLPTRIGGFGGVDGLRRFLRDRGIEAVVDATHPFAVAISGNATRAAAAEGVPILRISRPPWRPAPGDRWIAVPDMEAAASALGAEPCRVFLTVGRRDLEPFRVLAGHHRYLVRSVDPPLPASLPPRAETVLGRGPFTEADEHALMLRSGVQVLVSRNSGGGAAAPKLVAARSLGLPVVMIDRAPGGDDGVPAVPDWRDALRWIRDVHGSASSGSTPRGV
ncbi:MAG: cobalt-precorrin-6A reductase [Gluconacetobacter diazotrophicus]|nr:cobalt-precorrin-6A reductase [Gluconacetobacter diazotrophicus]